MTIMQIQQPTTMQGIVSIVNTLVTWLTPLLLVWVVRIQINNGERQRKAEAAQRAAEAAAADAAVEVARNVGEAQKATVEVAKKVDTVVTVAAEAVKAASQQGKEILILADKTHTLVNSKMGIVLKKLARKAREQANDKPTPENIRDAEDAELELADHVAKQREVDVKVEAQQQQQQ
jgi:hypothetical protein